VVAVDERLRPRSAASLAALLAPCLAVLGLLVAAYAVFLAVGFLKPVPGSADVAGPPTLANYAKFASDPAYWEILWRTVWFAALVALAAAVIGYPLAYAIARTESALLRRLLIAAVVVTFLSGSVTRAYGWLVILGNRGLLNGLMLALGLREQPLQMVFNHTGVFVALLHFVAPFFVLTLVGTVRNVPRSLEDAARIMGASRRRVFQRVILPLCLPGLIAGSLTVFNLCMGAFTSAALIGGGRVITMPVMIQRTIILETKYAMAAALSATLLVAVLLINLLSILILRRFRHGRQATA